MEGIQMDHDSDISFFSILLTHASLYLFFSELLDG